MTMAIPPKYAVSQVVEFIKGKSAIHLARVYGERKQLRGPNSTACASKSSSTLWPNVVSRCCPAAGSWNAASPGPHASADSPETTETARYHAQRPSSTRIRNPQAPKSCGYTQMKSLTGSSHVLLGATGAGSSDTICPAHIIICRCNTM
jgi:hypothetical protein